MYYFHDMYDTCPSDKMSFNVFAARCPSRDAFDAIFSKWGMLILMRLSEGPLRFGELKRAVDGISERMLSQTLKILEREEMVERRELSLKPPKVEYILTESGLHVAGAMENVVQVMYGELGRRFKRASKQQK